MNIHDDLYVILDIGRAASIPEIERAFRRMARRYHPDINPGDRGAEARFKRIAAAYEILSDPPKRSFYDQNGFYLDAGAADAVPGFAFHGFDFSRPRAQDPAPPLGDFLSHGAPAGPEPGADIEYPVSVSFADSMHGLRTPLALRRFESCGPCGSSGHARDGGALPCPACGGSGRAPRLTGRLQFSAPCADCGGGGQIVRLCPACGGDGRRSVIDEMEVDLPAGVGNHTRLRFPGKGHAGLRGGAVGDLYLVLSVTPHPTLSRAGDHIQSTVPIAFWEAALGAKIDVPTVDGLATIRIPPGTQSGQTLRLRGKGAPSLSQPGLRGDQFVTVQVVVPRIGDERSKTILRELALLNPDDPRKEIS